MRGGSSQFAAQDMGYFPSRGYPATCLSHAAGRVAPSLPTPSFEEVLLTAVAPPALDRELETEAINALRVLSIDAVQTANSGHPGLAAGRRRDGLRPLDRVPEAQPAEPALAGPRPLRPLRRSRLGAALLAALPDRLRSAARRAESTSASSAR